MLGMSAANVGSINISGGDITFSADGDPAGGVKTTAVASSSTTVPLKLYSESLRITYSTGDGIGQTGNLELLEDDFIHLTTCIDEGSSDDGERTAFPL